MGDPGAGKINTDSSNTLGKHGRLGTELHHSRDIVIQPGDSALRARFPGLFSILFTASLREPAGDSERQVAAASGDAF